MATAATINNLSKGALYGLLALFAALNYAVYALLPMLNDDYWYLARFAVEPWGEAVWQTIAEHAATDNIRLANLLMTLLVALPRWLSALVPGVAVLWLAAGVCRFGGVSRSLAGVLAAFVLLSFCLPWHEFLYSLCFSLNYVLPMAMAAWLMAPLAGLRRVTGADVAIAFILGFCNEAVAAPMFVVALLCRQRRIAAALAPGLIITALYLVLRDADVDVYAQSSIMHRVVQFGKLLWMWVLFVGVGLVLYLKRRRPVPRWVWGVIASAPICLAMAVMAPRGERLLCACELLSLMGLLRLSRHLVPGRPRLKMAVAAVMVVLLVWHYAAVLRSAYAIHRKWPQADILAESAAEGALFVDLEGVDDQSLVAWRKPMPMLLEGYAIDMFRYYHTVKRRGYTPRDLLNDKCLQLYPVPEVLRGVTTGAGEQVPGTAGVRRYRGWLYGPAETTGEYMPGQTGLFARTLYFYAPEFTGADGRKYRFLYPQWWYFPTFLLPITRIDRP